MEIDRHSFYEPEVIAKDVEKKVSEVMRMGESIDYLTFVPDGEPTLDINLGREIELLKPLGIRIAVITNASLIWRPDIREELAKADLVSLKMDSTREEIWHRINRPHRMLRLESILDGMLEFARVYDGELITETMLIKEVNAERIHAGDVADFLSKLMPAKAYLAIPTRPPAEEWIRSPSERTVNTCYQIFDKRIGDVEYLIGYEGNAFSFTGNVEEDLLSIMAVHPMREEAIQEFLKRAKSDWTAIQRLIVQGQIIGLTFEGHRFYMRRLSGNASQT